MSILGTLKDVSPNFDVEPLFLIEFIAILNESMSTQTPTNDAKELQAWIYSNYIEKELTTIENDISNFKNNEYFKILKYFDQDVFQSKFYPKFKAIIDKYQTKSFTFFSSIILNLNIKCVQIIHIDISNSLTKFITSDDLELTEKAIHLYSEFVNQVASKSSILLMFDLIKQYFAIFSDKVGLNKIERRISVLDGIGRVLRPRYFNYYSYSSVPFHSAVIAKQKNDICIIDEQKNDAKINDEKQKNDANINDEKQKNDANANDEKQKSDIETIEELTKLTADQLCHLLTSEGSLSPPLFNILGNIPCQKSILNVLSILSNDANSIKFNQAISSSILKPVIFISDLYHFIPLDS